MNVIDLGLAWMVIILIIFNNVVNYLSLQNKKTDQEKNAIYGGILFSFIIVYLLVKAYSHST